MATNDPGPDYEVDLIVRVPPASVRRAYDSDYVIDHDSTENH